MATRGAVLRGAMSIPGGARPTPAPQSGGMNFSGGRALNAPSIGQPSPLAAQLANEGGGYTRMYGGFLPRPTGDFTAGAFGPFSPILPVPVDEPPEGAVRPEARRFEYQVGWNLPVGQPGQEGLKLTSFETMRRLADVYSVARACIEYRKNQVKGIDWDIIPTPEATKSYQQSPSLMADFGKRRAKALKFFKKPDQDYMTFGTWISVVVEELLVYDALSLLMRPVRGKGRGKGVLGSDFASFMTVHGPTIRPLLDLHGGTPRPPAPAYQQYLYGVPRSDYLTMITQDDIDDAGLSGSEVGSFRGDQLLYLPSVPRAWTPYGFSAIERALIPIMTGLQKQGFQYDWFAESTVPSAYIIPGDTAMTPNQLRELQDALNAIAGDPAWKQKIIVLPPGSHVEPQRPGAPADELDQLLFTETCMAFGLSPMEIGVTPARSSSMGAQNQMAKMSQKTSEDAGLTPILKFFQDIFNLILQQVCNQEDMLFTFEGLQEEEDVESLTGVLVQQVQNGLRTVDEARQELNMQPYGLEETTEPLFVTPNGPVPLSTAIKNAESAAAQQEAQAQQTQAGVAQTHANIAQSLAGMAATQAGTAATQQNTEVARSRLQMQQEQHEVSMNEPGAGQMQERSQDHQAGMATQAQQHQSSMAQQAQRAQAQQAAAKDGKPTPGHAAARAGNREAANTKKSFDPVLVKRQAAEYGALVRHLNKGRPVSTWEAKFVPEAVLADVAKGMAHGLAPSDAVSAAKTRAEVQLAPSEYEWVTHQVGERLVTTHNGAVKVADAGPKAGEFDFVAKVGKKGYIHGWIYVGKSYDEFDDDDRLKGQQISHPEFGTGHITGTTMIGVDDQGRYEGQPGFNFDTSSGYPAITARFSDGQERMFEARAPSAAGDFYDPGGLDEDPVVSVAAYESGLYHRGSDPQITAPSKPYTQAMADYISPRGNAKINNYLRNGDLPLVPARRVTPMEDHELTGAEAAIRREVATLDRAIASHKLKEDTKLYRGIALTPSLEQKMLPGATFTDPAFVSASMSPDWAEKFAQARVTGHFGAGSTVTALGGTPVIMRIHVPKGTHVAPGQPNLGEYVMPRGTKFQVNSVSNNVMDVSVVS